MKKLVLGFTLLLTAVILLGCQGSAFSMFAMDTDEEILSFSALTSTTLLSHIAVSEPLAATSLQPLEAVTVEEEIVEIIEPYLDMIEKFVGNNQGLSVTTEASDLEGYETMMTFQTVDILGMPTTYQIYYNMTLTEEEFDEREFQIDGILIYGDVEYTVYGKKEIEEDEEEIKFRASIDELNYVESSYEIEEDEYKFIFKTFVDGIMTSESKIKVETEDFELKIEMEYEQGLDYGNYEFKYENEDGEDILKIQFSSQINGISREGEIKVLVEVDPVTAKTTYALYVKGDDSEEEKKIDRDRRDDDDDAEENEDSDDSSESDPEENDESEIEDTDESNPEETDETEVEDTDESNPEESDDSVEDDTTNPVDETEDPVDPVDETEDPDIYTGPTQG